MTSGIAFSVAGGTAVATPSSARFYALYARGLAAGLSRRAATGYATLGWWLEHYDIQAPKITSGKRSKARQKELQRRWDRGDRAGLVARPADNSAHTEGEAFDVSADSWTLQVMGAWAPYAGLRWGGAFADPVHFDTRS